MAHADIAQANVLPAWLAPTMPIAWLAVLALSVALSELVLLIVWFGCRRLAGIPIRRKSGAGLDGLPYGIAIGAGAIITAVTSYALV